MVSLSSKSSSFQATPLYCVINEIPRNLQLNYMLYGGVWYGKCKAHTATFLKPLVPRFNELSSVGVAYTNDDAEVGRMRFHVLFEIVDAVYKAEVQCIRQLNAHCTSALWMAFMVCGGKLKTNVLFKLLNYILQPADLQSI